MTKYDPAGCEIGGADFNIPLVGVPLYRHILLEIAYLKVNGQSYLCEHIIEYRNVLTIRNYRYWVSPDGSISKIL